MRSSAQRLRWTMHKVQAKSSSATAITVAGHVHAVAGDARESQLFRQALTIDREGGSRQGSRAHGEFVGVRAALASAESRRDETSRNRQAGNARKG